RPGSRTPRQAPGRTARHHPGAGPGARGGEAEDGGRTTDPAEAPAQRSSRRAPPPHRPATREDPRGVAPAVPGPAQRPGHHRAARRAHRDHPELLSTAKAPRRPGRPQRLVSASAGHQVRTAPIELRRHRDLHRDLDELLGVLVGVVATEHQLPTASDHDSQLGRCAATVTALFGTREGHRLRRRGEGWGHRLLLLWSPTNAFPVSIPTYHPTPEAEPSFPPPTLGSGSHHPLYPCGPV